jgi:hypothetical protein
MAAPETAHPIEKMEEGQEHTLKRRSHENRLWIIRQPVRRRHGERTSVQRTTARAGIASREAQNASRKFFLPCGGARFRSLARRTRLLDPEGQHQPEARGLTC